ncbi:MAG: Ni/Fe hydrogenase subunit alpha [Candidatus Marinimicrobia bacterium]|nr:Ni/Fe hydrogenase subunit alpha [Candidatus Neomarinimicrobiota bacterium]MDP6965855.1 Ni/Fe hydrogenase subunit alpha [Candidatus Neomarinimicrobiota bacterium]
MNALKNTKTIKVDYLARVEGEGALFIKIKDNELQDCKLKIFEPPRFFEAFLQGRHFTEAPDITARICGICPIAYIMSSIHAMERILGIEVGGQLRELRRLIYCGEWIESHVLHVFMLHAPDFLGYQDAIQLAGDKPELVKMALRLKKAGNELVRLLGGREIHPINNKVGGFYKVPEKQDFAPLLEELKWAKDASIEAVKVANSLECPDFDQDYEFIALHHPDEYPFNEGRLISNTGLDIDIQDYEDHFEEIHVEHSNALHSIHIEHGNYFVGPLARYNLNYNQLSELTKQVAVDIGYDRIVTNPFQSIVVRSLETVYAIDEAIRIIENYEKPEKPAVDYDIKPGIGWGCTEAPRGILYHRYEIDEKGTIKTAKIVPPTAQNQSRIEEDLSNFIPKYMDLSDEDLTWKCEQAVRNYDPCISCATHFLKLDIERE